MNTTTRRVLSECAFMGVFLLTLRGVFFKYPLEEVDVFMQQAVQMYLLFRVAVEVVLFVGSLVVRFRASIAMYLCAFAVIRWILVPRYFPSLLSSFSQRSAIAMFDNVSPMTWKNVVKFAVRNLEPLIVTGSDKFEVVLGDLYGSVQKELFPRVAQYTSFVGYWFAWASVVYAPYYLLSNAVGWVSKSGPQSKSADDWECVDGVCKKKE